MICRPHNGVKRDAGRIPQDPALVCPSVCLSVCLSHEWNPTVSGVCVCDWLISLVFVFVIGTASSGLTRVVTCVRIPSFLRLTPFRGGTTFCSPVYPSAHPHPRGRAPLLLLLSSAVTGASVSTGVQTAHGSVSCHVAQPKRARPPRRPRRTGKVLTSPVAGRRPAPWAPHRTCFCGRVSSKLRLHCRPPPLTASPAGVPGQASLGWPSRPGGLAPALPTCGLEGELPAASLRWPVELTCAQSNN